MRAKSSAKWREWTKQTWQPTCGLTPALKTNSTSGKRTFYEAKKVETFGLPSYWRNTSQWSTEGSKPAMHHEKLFLWFGTLREILWPMTSTTYLFGLQHADTGVLPYHELLTSICDNCRCVYVCWMRERVHVYTEVLICTQSYNMLLSQVKDFIAIYLTVIPLIPVFRFWTSCLFDWEIFNVIHAWTDVYWVARP